MAKAKRTPLDKLNTLLFGKDLRLPRASHIPRSESSIFHHTIPKMNISAGRECPRIMCLTFAISVPTAIKRIMQSI